MSPSITSPPHSSQACALNPRSSGVATPIFTRLAVPCRVSMTHPASACVRQLACQVKRSARAMLHTASLQPRGCDDRKWLAQNWDHSSTRGNGANHKAIRQLHRSNQASTTLLKSNDADKLRRLYRVVCPSRQAGYHSAILMHAQHPCRPRG